MERVGEDVIQRCSRASRSLVQNIEQVAGGSNLVGTYHRTRGVQRWGQEVQRDHDLHGMDMARKPVSETEDSHRLGRRACCALDGEKGRVVVLTVASVKAWLRGSMADAPGRGRCGGPGR
jgi:hypothetical protein